MSRLICALCGDLLARRDDEQRMCVLCEVRTLPEERDASGRRLLGLIDSA